MTICLDCIDYYSYSVSVSMALPPMVLDSQGSILCSRTIHAIGGWRMQCSLTAKLAGMRLALVVPIDLPNDVLFVYRYAAGYAPLDLTYDQISPATGARVSVRR